MKPSFHLTPTSSSKSLCCSSVKLWCRVLNVTWSPSQGKYLQILSWWKTDPLEKLASGSCSGSICISFHTLQPEERASKLGWDCFGVNTLEVHQSVEQLLSRGQAGPALRAVPLLSFVSPPSGLAPGPPRCESKNIHSLPLHKPISISTSRNLGSWIDQFIW